MTDIGRNVYDSFERLSEPVRTGARTLEGRLTLPPEDEQTLPLHVRVENRLRVNRFILSNLGRAAA